MPGKVLILAGAPDSKTLDWHSPGLLSAFVEPIAQFAGTRATSSSSAASGQASASASASASAFASAPSFIAGHAAWRSIPLRTIHMPTGFSQRWHGFVDPDAPGNASFPGSTGPSSLDSDTDASSHGLTQFHEHSLAVFEDLNSSGLVADDTQGATSLATDGTASFASTNASLDPPAPGTFQAKGPLPLGMRGSLTNLQDIPSAAYLAGIEPQTMTVNLIVGIISLAAPRTIRTRWGSTRTLVEVLVGDDTRAGFAVTFWLFSDSVQDSVLSDLRSQDLVLLQNVALNVFAKKVYGSSLRKDLTKVHLLYRRRLGSESYSGYYGPADMMATSGAHAQLVKAQKVWDWVLNFVGRPVARLERQDDWEEAPPETQ